MVHILFRYVISKRLFICSFLCVTYLFPMVLNYISANPCPSSHHCVDGSCISWSKTCTQTAFCGDGTNTPSVCGKSGLVLYISQKKPNLNAWFPFTRTYPNISPVTGKNSFVFLMCESKSMKMASCVASCRPDRFRQRLRFFLHMCSFLCRFWTMPP